MCVNTDIAQILIYQYLSDNFSSSSLSLSVATDHTMQYVYSIQNEGREREKIQSKMRWLISTVQWPVNKRICYNLHVPHKNVISIIIGYKSLRTTRHNNNKNYLNIFSNSMICITLMVNIFDIFDNKFSIFSSLA